MLWMICSACEVNYFASQSVQKLGDLEAKVNELETTQPEAGASDNWNKISEKENILRI